MKHVMIASVFALWIGVVSSPAQQINSAVGLGSDVRPAVTVLPLSASTVTDLHLRPMFTTTIRLPEAVTSVAVGAPTLFEVEHSDQEPRLVFVKPSTKDAATSNLIIALQSGHEISIRLISEGAAGTAPVDFVVNYQPQQSFLIGSADPVVSQENDRKGVIKAKNNSSDRSRARAGSKCGDAGLGGWSGKAIEKSRYERARQADGRSTGRCARSW